MISPHRAALSLALGAALVFVLFVVKTNPPSAGGFYPPCLFHKLTGLHCPGCGGTRCLHALLNLRFSEALHMNIALLIALPFLAATASRWWWRWVRGLPQVAARPMKPWLASGIAISVIAFAVLRNLPWPPFSFLAPH